MNDYDQHDEGYEAHLIQFVAEMSARLLKVRGGAKRTPFKFYLDGGSCKYECESCNQSFRCQHQHFVPLAPFHCTACTAIMENRN